MYEFLPMPFLFDLSFLIYGLLVESVFFWVDWAVDVFPVLAVSAMYFFGRPPFLGPAYYYTIKLFSGADFADLLNLES